MSHKGACLTIALQGHGHASSSGSILLLCSLLSAEDAVEKLLDLSPFDLKHLLHLIFSSREFTVDESAYCSVPSGCSFIYLANLNFVHVDGSKQRESLLKFESLLMYSWSPLFAYVVMQLYPVPSQLWGRRGQP